MCAFQVTIGLWSLVRGIDFLARHAHHESFEYPLGSFRGGAIQRPLKEMCNQEGDRAADDSQESTGDDVPVLASAANGQLEPAESLYPYLVVCGKECYCSDYPLLEMLVILRMLCTHVQLVMFNSIFGWSAGEHWFWREHIASGQCWKFWTCWWNQSWGQVNCLYICRYV